MNIVYSQLHWEIQLPQTLQLFLKLKSVIE